LKRGMVSFAGGGTDSRTTQLFVSLRDSKYLGKANWETPIAQVVEGMDVVDTWYKGCASIDPISLPTLQRHRKLCHLEAFDVLASSTVAI
jgi:cyclophilin family peptidyl-prolyl cis-trans isomerase